MSKKATKHSRVRVYSPNLTDITLNKNDFDDINVPNVVVANMLNGTYSVESDGVAAAKDWIRILEDAIIILKNIKADKEKK